MSGGKTWQSQHRLEDKANERSTNEEWPREKLWGLWNRVIPNSSSNLQRQIWLKLEEPNRTHTCNVIQRITLYGLHMALLSADLLRIRSTHMHALHSLANSDTHHTGMRAKNTLTHTHTIYPERKKKRNFRSVKVFNVTIASDYELKSPAKIKHQLLRVSVCIKFIWMFVCFILFFGCFAAFCPSIGRSLRRSQFTCGRLGQYFHFRL